MFQTALDHKIKINIYLLELVLNCVFHNIANIF